MIYIAVRVRETLKRLFGEFDALRAGNIPTPTTLPPPKIGMRKKLRLGWGERIGQVAELRQP